MSEDDVYAERRRICDVGLLAQPGFSKPDEHGDRTLFKPCPAGPINTFLEKRGQERNTADRSREGQTRYFVEDVVADILGEESKQLR